MSIEATILDNGISANIATAAVSATFSGGINIDVDTLALATDAGAAMVGKSGGGTVQGAVDDLVVGDLASRGLSQTDASYAYDEFDRSDRALNGDTAPTGQVYTVTGTGIATAAIIGGVVYDPGNANFYANLPIGAQIQRATIQFSFEPTGEASPTANSRQVVLIIQNGTGLGDLQAHCQFNIDGFTCDTRAGGTWNFGAIQGGYDLQPGVVYQGEVIIDGTTLTVIDPFGQSHSTTIAANSGIVGSTLSFQIFDDGSTYAYDARVHAISAGKAVAAKRAVATGGLPVGEALLFRGKGLRRTQIAPEWTATTTGWHRILTGSTFGTFAAQGVVFIEATAADSTREYVELEIHAPANSTPTITQLRRHNYGSPMPQVRVSNDGTDEIGIDIYLDNATASNVTVRTVAKGAFELVANPQPGAVVLAGTATTFALESPGTPPLTATLTTNGWHRIAIGSTRSSFSMAALLDISAVDAIGRATEAQVQAFGRYDGGFALTALKEIYSMSLLAHAITQVRISRDSSIVSTSGIVLDINAPNAGTNNVTLTISADPGYLTFQTPVSGATALATENQVLTLT